MVYTRCLCTLLALLSLCSAAQAASVTPEPPKVARQADAPRPSQPVIQNATAVPEPEPLVGLAGLALALCALGIGRRS